MCFNLLLFVFVFFLLLLVAFNKPLKHHPTKQIVYNHSPTITQTIKISQARHAGHYNELNYHDQKPRIRWFDLHGIHC